MNLLNRLTVKSLLMNKKRTTATIIGIMLSVALITAVAGVFFSGVASLIKWESNRKGNFHVVFRNVLVSDVSDFENNRKIEGVYLSEHIGYAEIKESANSSKPYAHIMSFSEEALKNLLAKLTEGRLPQNENEILIPTHLKTNGRINYKVGDTVRLDVGKRVNEYGELKQNDSYSDENPERIIDADTREYTIVGVMKRPSYHIEDFSAPGYTFITLLDEQNLTGSVDVYTRYTKEGLKNFLKVTANILGVDADIYEKIHSNQLFTQEEYERYTEEFGKAKYTFASNNNLIILENNPLEIGGAGALTTTAVIVGLIIIFTSVFCIRNSFDISITEKTKQYGMLRSVGATKKQIRKNVLYEAFILGVIGIPMGILLGFLATFFLLAVSNLLMSEMLSGADEIKLELIFEFSWAAVLLAVLSGALTIYLSSIKSAIKAGKVSPIESIRSNKEITNKKLKTPGIIKKIFGVCGEISFKNLKRNRKKHRTTVISILVSVASFVALTSFVSFAFDYAANRVKEYDYDVGVFLGRRNKDAYTQVLETLKLEDVEKYSVIRTESLQIHNVKYSDQYKALEKESHIYYGTKGYADIIAVGDAEYRDFVKKIGINYEEVKDKAILMDTNSMQYYNTRLKKTVTSLIKEFGYEKGNIISGTLSISKSKITDETTDETATLTKDFSIEVACVTTEKPLGTGRKNSSFLLVSDEVYDSKVLEYDQAVNVFYKSNNPDKLQDEIDVLLQNYGIQAYNVSEEARNMENFFTLLAIFLYGFIVVISLIGITNVFNTITASVNLRKREFATLKSIGMTKKEFNRMIRLESIFTGMKSLIFGLPIGLGLSYLIHFFLLKESGTPYNAPITAVIISVAVVFLLIAAIMKYSISKTNKQNTIETIRNENI